MAFNETEIFPGCPKFGFSSSPLYSVEIVETAGAQEYRNENWSQAKRLILVTVGPGPGGEREVEELLRFYQAHGGPTDGFRFWDRSEWKSVFTDQTPTPSDQPLVLVSGAIYQLTMRYTAGTISRDRQIYKPYIDADFGGILVADGGAPKVEGVDYVVDYTTGLVTLNFSPSGTLTWGGTFHIPVRFDGEFPVQIINYRAKSVSFVLKELPLEDD